MLQNKSEKPNLSVRDLIQEYEIDSVNNNNLLYLKVLKEFIKIVGIDKILECTKCTPLMLFDVDYSRNHISRILNYFFSKPENLCYVEDFYLILEQNGYQIENNELKRAFYNIGEFGEYGLKNLNSSPVIDNVVIEELNGMKVFIISSATFGKILVKKGYDCFSREISLYYFPIMDFKESLRKHCHSMTQEFVLESSGHHAYTSLCADAFSGEHYHSYAFSPETDEIIDFNRKIVASASDFNKIFLPRVIKVTKGDSLNAELSNLRSKRKMQYEPLLELAINEQLKMR